MKELMNFFKRLFRLNSQVYLQEAVGVGSDGVSIAPSNLDNTCEDNYMEFKLSESNLEEKNDKVNAENSNDENNKDYISLVFNENKKEISECNNDEFVYDPAKVPEMNQKIDYYKKKTDELDNLELQEILELVFYYKKRIEKRKVSK